jgi:hypothetical protein
MMEAASISETSLNFYQTTQRYNTEDSHLQICNKLTSGLKGLKTYNEIGLNAYGKSQE